MRTSATGVGVQRPADHDRQLRASPPCRGAADPDADRQLHVTTFSDPGRPGRHRGRVADRAGAGPEAAAAAPRAVRSDRRPPRTDAMKPPQSSSTTSIATFATAAPAAADRVLIVAMIAVPLLLSSQSRRRRRRSARRRRRPARSKPRAPDAAVLADAGLRDYRERLEGCATKNPFASRRRARPAEGRGIGHERCRPRHGAGQRPRPASASGSGGHQRDGHRVEHLDVDRHDGRPTDGSGAASGGGGSSQTSVVELAFRVDVKVGPARRHASGARTSSYLTSCRASRTPVAALPRRRARRQACHLPGLRATCRQRAATGRCMPKPADCQFLNLRMGDETKFEYAPSGEPDTFVIRVLDIRLERNSDTAGSGDRDAGARRSHRRPASSPSSASERRVPATPQPLNNLPAWT